MPDCPILDRKKRVGGCLSWLITVHDRRTGKPVQTALTDMVRLLEAADITMSRKSHAEPWQIWKYFCGVCWKKIKED